MKDEQGKDRQDPEYRLAWVDWLGIILLMVGVIGLLLIAGCIHVVFAMIEESS